MNKEENMKLSNESDGKMDEKVEQISSTADGSQEKEEFFNTTQNSE